jgi:O-acetylhomoserine (thiol)-lyase
MKPETLALHAGYTSDPTTKAAAVPIYQTTSYTFDDTRHGADLFNLDVAGNIYTRIMNPTTAVLEARVAALEGGIAALCTASGMAAITYAVQTLVEAGDNIIATKTLYGGTYNFFAHNLPRQGIEVRFIDPERPEQIAEVADERTRLVYCESIGNPAINVVDMRAFAQAAHAQGLPLMVDNTVPSPALFRPIEHGADIVVQSLTKYIGGHGTSIGGAIIDAGRFEWALSARFDKIFNQPDPFLPRRELLRPFRPRRLHRPRPRGAAAQHRRRALADECVFNIAGLGNLVVEDAAPLRKRAQSGRISAKPPASGVGKLSRLARQPLSGAD